MGKETDSAVPRQRPGQGGDASHIQAGSERIQAQGGAFSQQEPLLQSAHTPALRHPTNSDVHGSKQSPSSEQDASDTCSMAYTLEWGPHTRCTRTPLHFDVVSAENSFGTLGASETSDQSRINAIRSAWKCDVEMQAEAGPLPTHKLFVFRDTGNEDASRILCSVLDIDPEFLAAHNESRRYRPRVRLWRVGARRSKSFFSAYYAYPQTLTVTVSEPLLLSSSHDTNNGKRPNLTRPNSGMTHSGVQDGNNRHTNPRDRVEKAPDASSATLELNYREHNAAGDTSYPSSSEKIDRPVVVLCRASLWIGPQANVLFLDKNLSSTALEDAVPYALDDMPIDNSSATESESQASFLADTLSGLAYDRWLDFIDTLSSDRRGARQSKLNTTLLWDMAQRLEQNLEISRAYEKQLNNPQRAAIGAHPDDWQALLSRLQRIVSLLPLQAHGSSGEADGTITANFSVAGTSYNVGRILPNGTGRSIVQPTPEVAAGSKTADVPHPYTNIKNSKHQPSSSGLSAEHNALKRITYMGGFLLPFSIIAGVLSMSDPFGPGDRLFWVFWVITLPITALTLVIIYADEIRRSYIWKPLNHKSLEEAIKKGEAISNEDATALAQDAKRIIDKVSALESDSDIESDTVLSAVRLDELTSSTGGQARVSVNTRLGPGRPTFYRLSQPSRLKRTAVVPLQPQQSRLSNPVTEPVGNVQLQNPIANASVRHRFHILGPLRRVWSTKTRQGHADHLPKPEAEPLSFLGDIEPAIVSDEKVVINAARPNVDPSIATMFGPPSGIDATVPGFPTILLPQKRRDTDPAAWRRQQLGWFGAIKKMAGYLKTEDA
ncbi:hypothetical protein SEPCBS57363_005479 [Sporothrix epigloea]|uniref:Uncharacterized protein n=1 Tax=Sporothrix epigloea TaxID=1892477 RepID=A0ABP0E1G3_9PEZI